MYLPKTSSLLFILFVTVVVLVCIPSSVRAQSVQQDTFYNRTTQTMDAQKQQAIQDSQDGQVRIYDEAVASSQQDALMHSLTNKIVCTSADPAVCDPNQTTMGALAKAMGTLYENPPASGLAYTRHVLARAGFVPSVNAQGIGFVGLTPFLPFWIATRNIAYSTLILVMVAIGFLIIFRAKIDPKTVISVQAALPKIVLTLITITLSYPIVGFLVDAMYVVMAVAIKILVDGLGGAISGTTGEQLQSIYINSNVITLLGAVFGGVASGVQFLGPGLAGAVPITALIDLFATSAGWVTFLPIIILGLIIVLGLLFTFIRLFLLLLNSYIQLLVNLIIAPILLLPEAIPGRTAFKDWILTVMANLIVFPVTALLIMFAVWLGATGQAGIQVWTPPFIGFPGQGGIWHAMIGLGIIFLSPQLVAQSKKLFHPKPALPISAGTAFAPLTGAVQTGMGAASQFYYMQQMPVIGKLFGGGGQGARPH